MVNNYMPNIHIPQAHNAHNLECWVTTLVALEIE